MRGIKSLANLRDEISLAEERSYARNLSPKRSNRALSPFRKTPRKSDGRDACRFQELSPSSPPQLQHEVVIGSDEKSLYHVVPLNEFFGLQETGGVGGDTKDEGASRSSSEFSMTVIPDFELAHKGPWVGPPKKVIAVTSNLVPISAPYVSHAELRFDNGQSNVVYIRSPVLFENTVVQGGSILKGVENTQYVHMTLTRCSSMTPTAA